MANEFPKSGVGSGLIAYRVLGPRHLRVPISSRAEGVGAGSGITSGGWMPLALLGTKPDGAIIRLETGAVRESVQEVPGILKVLPREVLFNNMQYLFGASIHKPKDPYGNTFHTGVYYGLAVTEPEEVALCNLPTSKETSAPLRAVDIRWEVDNPTPEDLIGLPTDFHHDHERYAYAALAQMADRNRLWLDRVAA
ncbi:MAG: hypothetical protein DI585_01520 [Pseudomonas fluorescens]|nr:MAG: hypothetical protein DI585_01520 [Pseudomonas fluorescens]